MMSMRKHYTAAFKAQVVQEILKEDRTIAQISAEFGVHPTMLHKWKKTVIENMIDLFQSEPKKNMTVINKEHEKQVEQLYSDIGRLTTQLAWIKKKSGLNPE